jgi:hypothetical protein
MIAFQQKDSHRCSEIYKLLDKLCFVDAPMHALTLSSFQHSFPYQYVIDVD